MTEKIWEEYLNDSASNREQEYRKGRNVTLVGLFANIFLVCLKFVCGILGHSQALIADAVHSVSDLLSDAVVLVGLSAGRKAPDQEHHFGHGRLETLSASAVSLSLILVGIYLGMDAVWRIYFSNYLSPGWLAAVAAAFSILTKEAMYQYTMRAGERIRSTVVMANAWHHRSDAWSSVAVLLGVLGTWIRPGLCVLDAVAALVVALFIMKTGFSIFWGTVVEFTDRAPEPVVLDKIKTCVCGVPGVRNMHDLKVRTTTNLLQMQMHIVVDGQMTVSQGHQVAKQVEACLFRDIKGVLEVIVHLDPSGEEQESQPSL